MDYVTVFDASQAPFRNFSFLLTGVAVTAVGAVLVFLPNLFGAIGMRKPPRFFSWFYFLFALACTVGAGASLATDAMSASRRVKDGNCDIVEGRVEKFHPMPAGGHDTERFEVGGVRFAYSDYVVTAGFNNTASHGGPIREGLPVRICHRDGQILILEIARDRPVSPT